MVTAFNSSFVTSIFASAFAAPNSTAKAREALRASLVASSMTYWRRL
jgi:hypothetical protein